MKCSVAQTRMLELERPDRPTPPLRAHLARCSACREWFHQFVQIERNVSLLPVPPSTRKEEFLRQVLTGEPTPGRNGTGNSRESGPARVLRRERGLRKMALATGLAAGLVLFAIGLMALQPTLPRGGGRPETLVEKLLKHDLKLAAASTAQKRVEQLAALADDLHRETGELALTEEAPQQELLDLARLYQKVVHEGLVTQAEKVPADERPRLLEIAGRLEQTRQKAAELAASLPSGSVPLSDIATAAGKAEARVRDLAERRQP